MQCLVSDVVADTGFRVTRNQHTLTGDRGRTSKLVLKTLITIAGWIGDGMQIAGANSLMMRCRMMFGEIICLVAGAVTQLYGELALADAIAKPRKAYVDALLGSALFDDVVGEACGGVIVGDNGSGRLGMAKFLKAGTSLLSIVNQGSRLGYNFLKNSTENVESTIAGRRGGVGGRWAGRVTGSGHRVDCPDNESQAHGKGF